MSGDEEVTEQTRAVVQRMLDGINSGDRQAVLSCFSPNVHFWMPGSTEIHGHYHGIEAFARVSETVYGRLSERITLSLDNLVASGEYAFAQADGTARTKKGEPYNNTYCFIWRVQDGLVTEMTEYHDTDLVRRVLLA